MATGASLANAAINLNALRELAKDELAAILQKFEAPTRVVIDDGLSKPLEALLGAKTFKDNGVDAFSRLGDPVSSDATSVLFVVRPDAQTAKRVAVQVTHLVRQFAGRRIGVCFAPRATFLCTAILRDAKAFQHVTIHELGVDLIPLEDDVVSMELGTAFRECALEGDTTALSFVARALLQLQSAFGRIPSIRAKGRHAVQVLEMMSRLRAEEGADGAEAEEEEVAPQIDKLVIIDREVDLVTPMVIPLTYEALIDQLVGLEAGTVMLDESVAGDQGDKKKKKEGGMARRGGSTAGAADTPLIPVPLNSNGKLFAQIRDFNISVLPPHLQEQSREIQRQYEERPKDAQHTVQELQDFVKKIPHLKEAFQELSIHIHLTERVTATTNDREFRERWQVEREVLEGDYNAEFLFTAIAKQEPLLSVLRLACLHSLVHGGFKAKAFDQLRREIVQTYGFEQLITLMNLERVRLLRRREGSSHWASLRSKLNLIVDDVSVSDPRDAAYVTSGYAPLSCRLAERMLVREWRSLYDVFGMLPGPHAAVEEGSTAAQAGADGSDANASTPADGASHGRKVAMVFFVGGVTHAEIAALRLLGRRPDSEYEVIVGATKVINGDSLLQQFLDDVPREVALRRDTGL